MVDEAIVRAVVDGVDEDEVLRFAARLIETPSENPGGSEEEVAEVAVGILEGLGGKPQIVRGEEGRPSVVARFGAGDRPALAWNGHLDVVPTGDPATWRHPPYGAEIEDGRMIGRGAVDMKGSIASALAAVAAIRRAGVELDGRLDLHLVADEEMAGAHGTNVLLEQGYLDQDAAIVGEASELTVMLAERGGAWVTASARGRAAHGSRPHEGVNAITSMSRFLLEIEDVLPNIEHPLVGRPTVNAAQIVGGSAPNVVPDLCSVEIDRRTIPGERDQTAVLAPFEALAERIRADHPDVDLSFELKLWLEAAETASDSAIANACREALRDETGVEPPDTGFTGITDARFYINQRDIPTVLLGPGSLAYAHTADEFVETAELVTAARVFARVFLGFLGASKA
jgi:acetylornithine deacetylase/succinyl-diaminopimelate desuccinylase family protein